MTKEKRARIRAVKKDSHASQLLKVLRATGLFRWEKPSTHAEEVVNILTHGIGIGLAIAALTLLVVFAGLKGDPWAIVSCAIFGVTMITLYFGSTMCHATIGKKHECFFEVWDSVAIYALIAGTYTPFLLVSLRGVTGWVIFGIIWGLAILGTILKLVTSGSGTKIWSISLYLIMGWLIVFASKSLVSAIPSLGLIFLVLGGLFYTFGVLFYIQKSKKYTHAIWHFFVLSGTVMHFFAVLYSCVLA